MINGDALLDGKASMETPQDRPRVKPFNELLRTELQAYKEENSYSTKDLGSELGFSSTVVSKYLSGKPEGDVTKLEAVIDDVLRTAMKRAKAKAHLVPTNVTRELDATCETIRKTNDMALIFGPAGVGKTAGCDLYAARNPTCIMITVSAWHRNAASVVSLLWQQIRPRVWDNWNDSRASYIMGKLKDSNRLILVDNAHKLIRGGLDVLFDLHDATNVPVALCGFETVEETIKKDEQQFTRIGLKKKMVLTDTHKLASALVQQFIPEGVDDLLPLAEQVIEKQGHGRALRKQLLLAIDIKEKSPKSLEWVTAFRAAHTRLIRDYTLSVEGK